MDRRTEFDRIEEGLHADKVRNTPDFAKRIEEYPVWNKQAREALT